MNTPGQASIRGNRFLILALAAMAVLFLLWPCYRAFVQYGIDVNEPWNAHFADAAMGRMPLYPARDELITNNYPPISFYVVGMLGSLLDDSILAGRLLSIVSLLVIAVAIALMIRQLGGNTIACWLGLLYFLATMCRFFTDYVGMNDPQLFAQAIMSVGLLLFLKAMQRDSGYAAAFLVMILAGFCKHNLIGMPLTSFLWLGMYRPRQLLRWGAFSLAIIALGLGLCLSLYGTPFIDNLLAPRFRDWRHALGALGHLQWVAPALVCWCYVGFKLRTEPAVRFCNLFIMVALVSFFLQKLGDGVGYNAQFDLVIAVSLAVGMAYNSAPRLAIHSRLSAETLRFILLLAVCSRLCISFRTEPFRWWSDPTFRQEIAVREADMARSIALIRKVPGNVSGSSYACYRAGKPFVFDFFNVEQRIKTGQMTQQTYRQIVKDKAITFLR